MFRQVTWVLLSTGFLLVKAAPTNGSLSCLDRCFENRDSIVAANDLRNLKKVLVDQENFCKNLNDVTACAQDCPDQAREFLEKSSIATKICQQSGLPEIGDCLGKLEQDPVESCLESCGVRVDESSAYRFDSNPGSPINPAAELESLVPTCRGHICSLQCSNRKLQQSCPAAAQLLKDLVEFQIGQQASIRMSKEELEKYYTALPDECLFIKETTRIDEIFALDPEMVTAPVRLEQEQPESTTVPAVSKEEAQPLKAASDEFTMGEALGDSDASKDLKLVSKEEETPAPLIISGGDEEQDEDLVDVLKDRKPDEPLVLASRDTKPEEETRDVEPHVFQPEDDFVPIGSPGNITEVAESAVTENPAVALAEEDVKLVNQPSPPKTEAGIRLDGEVSSEEVTARMEVLSSEENEDQTTKAAEQEAESDRVIEEGIEKMDEAIKKEKEDNADEDEEEKQEKERQPEEPTTAEPVLVVDGAEKESSNDLEEPVVTQSPAMVAQMSTKSAALTIGPMTIMIALLMAP